MTVEGDGRTITIVRVMDGFIYNNAIAEVEPRLEEASEVLDFLLS